MSFQQMLSADKRPALISSCFILLAYLGWFFTRSHIKVTQNVLADKGILTTEGLSIASSIAFAVNVFSKILGGSIIDASGRPKLVFIIGISISASMVVLNTFFTQLYGWVFFLSMICLVSAVGKLCSLKLLAARWPKEQMGFWGGMIHAGANSGEVVSKLVLGSLLDVVAWEKIFYIAAGSALASALPLTLFVSENPLPAKKTIENKANGEKAEPEGSFFQRSILPLMRIPMYWLVIALALTTTAIRELFNHFLPKYLKNFSYLSSNSTIVMLSAVCNVAAVISCLTGGIILDRVSKRNRGLVIIVFLLISCVMLAGLSGVGMMTDYSGFTTFLIAFVFVAIAAFNIVAANSFLDGAILVQIVGTEGLAVASGIVGASGYAGASLFSLVVGKLDKHPNGWAWIFAGAVCLNVIALIAAVFYWIMDKRQLQKEEMEAGQVPSETTEKKQCCHA